MIAPPKPDLVTVNVDGRDIAVPKGTNMIEAARLASVEVPHYCYHPKLTVAGNCRMCLVEMGLPAVDPATKAPIMDPATGKQKINWMPRPTDRLRDQRLARPAHPHQHADGQDCRKGVMEFLLINHPLDCPICDQAGECKLQEHSTAYGRGYSRFVEQKNVKPKRTQLGPRVTLDDERCILCSRCIRFCKEIAKDDVLGFIDRGSTARSPAIPGKKLENNYSLNTVDICPVGALTSTDFRFKMRVWFLKQTPSIDTESPSAPTPRCGAARAHLPHHPAPERRRERHLDGRFRPRALQAGEGRRPPHRLSDRSPASRPDIDGTLKAATAQGRLRRDRRLPAAAASRNNSSPRSSPTRSRPGLARQPGGAGRRILVSADRNPNVRGALVTGLIPPTAGAASSPRLAAERSTRAR
jgi:NADH-quinone oxidoreductase subunit G